jgi:hypothetical protein
MPAWIALVVAAIASIRASIDTGEGFVGLGVCASTCFAANDNKNRKTFNTDDTYQNDDGTDENRTRGETGSHRGPFSQVVVQVSVQVFLPVVIYAIVFSSVT